MGRIRRAGVVFVVLGGLAVAGCSSDSKSADTTAAPATTAPATTAAASTTAGGSTPAAGSTITIKDFQFDIPSGLKAGETVTISNEDSVDHTFSDQAGSFSIGADAGKPTTFTLPAAGTYTVICKIHDGMQGTLTVS